MTRLEQFDQAMRRVTEDRGAVYGPPRVNFDRIARLQAVIAECRDPLAKHVLDMLAVKIARLIETPAHLDSWIDLGGYARCGVMVTEPAPLTYGTPASPVVDIRDPVSLQNIRERVSSVLEVDTAYQQRPVHHDEIPREPVVPRPPPFTKK